MNIGSLHRDTKATWNNPLLQAWVSAEQGEIRQSTVEQRQRFLIG